MLLFNFSDFLNVFTKNFNIDGCSSASGSFKIEEGIFSLNTNLESIEIKCSLLTSIPETVSLKHLPDLRHLSFHGSGLETIPHDLAHYHDLITLDLESNPLNCNCSMLLLYRLLTLPNPVQVYWSVKVVEKNFINANQCQVSYMTFQTVFEVWCSWPLEPSLFGNLRV